MALMKARSIGYMLLSIGEQHIDAKLYSAIEIADRFYTEYVFLFSSNWPI